MTTTETNQETFLNEIAKNLGRPRKKEVTRPKWKKQPQWDVSANSSQDELVEQLKDRCLAIHTQVEMATLKTLPETLNKVLEQYEASSVIRWNDARFEEFGLESFFDKHHKNGHPVHIWDSEKEKENINFAEKADVGITFSDMTLAESATVTQLNNDGKGRSVSFLPKSYIAIIPKSTLVPRISQATRMLHHLVEEDQPFPSCVNFVSGPSNSADIEMNLVVGLHGPVRACYILVDDK
ncbi:LutC/YkgG family protein [Alkalicoccobacillus porphyridii]|uniref:Lactate utilization protein C n=1 Tax=Alkalicoccobacillus porphyridii TaxID=2597270 RepID=A0A554A0Q7_9BACI|nr:lactate utilization protein C [Alkalicoccobacillus porphyridii]TSB47275.1 lactate utilization protein C [Alkalicoccobacillus porphyridii]